MFISTPWGIKNECDSKTSSFRLMLPQIEKADNYIGFNTILGYKTA